MQNVQYFVLDVVAVYSFKFCRMTALRAIVVSNLGIAMAAVCHVCKRKVTVMLQKLKNGQACKLHFSVNLHVITYEN